MCGLSVTSSCNLVEGMGDCFHFHCLKWRTGLYRLHGCHLPWQWSLILTSLQWLSHQWQVTAKHTCTLHINKVTHWCIVLWCTQNMHQDGNSSTWHQPCNTQTALQPLQWIFRMLCVKWQSLIQSHIGLDCHRSAWKQRIALYCCHCEVPQAQLKMKYSTTVNII